MKVVNIYEKGLKKVFSLKIHLVLWAEITEANSHHVCIAVHCYSPINISMLNNAEMSHDAVSLILYPSAAYLRPFIFFQYFSRVWILKTHEKL